MSILIPAQLDLNLPAIRQVSLELIQALRHDDTALGEIAAIVRLDPVLTARVLAYANSPFMAALRPITDIHEAIIRIGRNEFRKVFYFTVLRDAFASHSPEEEAIMRRLWTQSLGVSIAAERIQMDLGQYFRLTEEEFAILSPLAILHAIGFVVLLHNFPQNFEALLTPPPASMPELLQRQQELFGGWDHAQAGASLLQAWYFPPLAVRCAAELILPPTQDNALAILLRLGIYLTIQAGLALFPDVPADFWTTPLPMGMEMASLLDIPEEVRQTVEMYSGIWQ